MKIFSAALLAIVSFYGLLAASPQKFDGIAAVVGDEIILVSELEAYTAMRLEQLKAQEESVDLEKFKADLLNDLIDNKVLITNAKRDSTLAVSDEEVENALNNHISGILRQNRMTMEQLEKEIYNQQGISLSRFRAEMRDALRDQLIQQKIQQTIYYSINTSRSDVEKFFETYKDSLPTFGESVRLSKLSLSVTPSQAQEEAVVTKIHEIKRKLDQGGDFEELAKEYSEGPQASAGGDLGFIAKGTVSEKVFEQTAFNLPQGQISAPFKTKLGFHIIQVLEKKENKVRVRQIFLQLTPGEEVVNKATALLESLKEKVTNSEEFVKAVKKHSTDQLSKSRGGDIGWFTLEELSASVRSAIIDLDEGQISEPVKEGNSFSVYRVDKKADSRKLNLDDDYSYISSKYKEFKANEKLVEKVQAWREKTFIDIRI